MAKSNEDGSVVNETLATDTLANLYPDLHDKIEIASGPQNDKPGALDDGSGFKVPIFIPRHYSQYANDLETWISSNWNREGAKDKSTGERVAFFERYVETEWEPKEPILRSPLENALFERLLQVNIEQRKPWIVNGKPSEREKSVTLMPTVVKNLNNPAVTERGRALVDAYVAHARDYDRNMVKRARKNSADTTTETDTDTDIADEI